MCRNDLSELLDTDKEFDEKYGANGEVKPGYNGSTLAINKEIPLELSRHYAALSKALMWVGALQSIGEDMEKNEFRVVLVSEIPSGRTQEA